jgi:tetratricopeptide (TPR) repeat protein
MKKFFLTSCFSFRKSAKFLGESFFPFVGILIFCLMVSCIDAVEVHGKMSMTITCLAPPSSSPLVLSKDEEQYLLKIKDFLKQEGVDFLINVTPDQLEIILNTIQSARDLKNSIIIQWSCFNGVKYSVESLAQLDSLLRDSDIGIIQYIEALNAYTVLQPYSSSSIKFLRSALTRKDLNDDQRFYLDARLAVFTTKESGLESFESLIKRYPNKRQCVAICGEQIALEYRGNIGNNIQKSMECYSKVFELCPEMAEEALSLLGYATICCEAGKPKTALDYLIRYADAHPQELDTLEILQTLASIYHDDLEEYDKAAQTWNKIVEFVVPESLLTKEIKNMKQRAKTNRETAISFVQSGRKKDVHFELQPRVFWTSSRIVVMTLNVFFIVSIVLFYNWQWKHTRNKK